MLERLAGNDALKSVGRWWASGACRGLRALPPRCLAADYLYLKLPPRPC